MCMLIRKVITPQRAVMGAGSIQMTISDAAQNGFTSKRVIFGWQPQLARHVTVQTA